MYMYNWNTNTIQLKKDSRVYAIWRLERLIWMKKSGNNFLLKKLEN